MRLHSHRATTTTKGPILRQIKDQKKSNSIEVYVTFMSLTMAWNNPPRAPHSFSTDSMVSKTNRQKNSGKKKKSDRKLLRARFRVVYTFVLIHPAWSSFMRAVRTTKSNVALSPWHRPLLLLLRAPPPPGWSRTQGGTQSCQLVGLQPGHMHRGSSCKQRERESTVLGWRGVEEGAPRESGSDAGGLDAGTRSVSGAAQQMSPSSGDSK